MDHDLLLLWPEQLDCQKPCLLVVAGHSICAQVEFSRSFEADKDGAEDG